MSGRWDPERFMREREQREFVGRSRDRSFDDLHHHHHHHHLDHHLDDFDDDYRRRPAAAAAAYEHDDFAFEGRFESRSGDLPRAQIVAERSAGTSRRGRFEEEERVKVYYEEPRRRDPIFLDDERESLESASRSALVPVRSAAPRARRQSIHVEREYVPPPTQRALALPARPKYVRRQSSLDTFDRRPRPMPAPLPRRRSPPTVRRYEEVEREQFSMPEPDYYMEGPSGDYREREVERSTREYRFKSTEVDEPEPQPHPLTRPGKTRMPRRLVEKSAIDMLGYPFEEELDHIVILRALAKDQIDEVVNLSKEIRSGRTTYVRQETRLLEAPPPQRVETVERRSEIVIPSPQTLTPAPPPVEVVRQVIREEVVPSPTTVLKVPAAVSTEVTTTTEQHHHHRHQESRSGRRKSRSSRRSKSKKRESSSDSSSDGGSRSRTVIEEREESNSISGPVSMFVKRDQRIKKKR